MAVLRVISAVVIGVFLVTSCGGDSDAVKALIIEGDELMGAGKTEEAIAKYDEAIALDSSFFQAFANRGYCHLLAGNYNLALGDLEYANKLKSGRFDIIYNTGLTLSKLGRNKDAMQMLNRAQKLNPKHSHIPLEIANCQFRQGLYKEAIGNYNLAQKAFPDSTNILLARGICYNALGNCPKSISDLEAYAFTHQDATLPLELLAGCYYQIDSIDKAITTFSSLQEMGIELSSGSKEKLAKCYTAKGDEERLKFELGGNEEVLNNAMQFYTTAINLDPSNKNAYFQRGLIQIHFNHAAEGCYDLNMAFTNGHKDAHAMMEGICDELYY